MQHDDRAQATEAVARARRETAVPSQSHHGLSHQVSRVDHSFTNLHYSTIIGGLLIKSCNVNVYIWLINESSPHFRPPHWNQKMSLPPLKAKIISGPEGGAAWNGLGDDSLSGPSQTADWFSHWHSNANADCLVAALYAVDKPVFILPLEVVKKGPVRVAIYAGGPHANCNFPALSRTQKFGRNELANLFDDLHKVRPDIDLVWLSRQLDELGGAKNPLLQLPARENANVSLAITLDRNFDTVLGRNNAKRKRKNHRQHTRRFEEAGGYRIVTATTVSETEAMLSNYFVWKADRVAKAGIKNTYEPAGIKGFFHQLFAAETHAAAPRFQLKALEVAGTYRAVLGKSHAKGQTFIDFIGIADDELASASPGEFLFFEDIQDSCNTDLSIYSFGIGDEPYKRSWCDIEIPTYDTNISLTTKGRMYAGYLAGRERLVQKVKQNDVVWARVKKVRSRLFGKA
ncbi:GNAT family N-acetyltransferase [Phyllobacterium brassicacearum]|uniref:GNAT family N-acetyltransferase n=2 Tax=Phyllobacterium brassicacearum TaxID=314235 RepID=A0A2P7BN38_9HYPH|nr:GNAT family N-acetyltransferase [Phyllobacterium brassicacearum]